MQAHDDGLPKFALEEAAAIDVNCKSCICGVKGQICHNNDAIWRNHPQASFGPLNHNCETPS